MIELRRYLGDTLSMQIHDADRERDDCRLGEIGPHHRRWYDSLEEARHDIPYRECPWCLGSSNRRAVEPGATGRETETPKEKARD